MPSQPALPSLLCLLSVLQPSPATGSGEWHPPPGLSMEVLVSAARQYIMTAPVDSLPLGHVGLLLDDYRAIATSHALYTLRWETQMNERGRQGDRQVPSHIGCVQSGIAKA
jgi:hypothetical protein